MSKKSVSRSILSYSSAMLLGQAVGVVQGLFVIRWMAPEVLGVWLQLQLIVIYGAVAHCGLVTAVNRQVPFHTGRGELERARHVEAVVRGVLMLFTALSLIVLAVAFLAGVGETDRGRGVLALTFVAVLQPGVQLHEGLFRARHQFGRAGLVSLANTLVILFGLPLVYYYGYDGLLVRAAAGAVIGLIACHALNGWEVHAKLDWRSTLDLLRIGLPIVLVGLGALAFTAMDRTMIAWLLDEYAMGQYALAFALARVMALFPTTIGQVYYPRMTELYAASGFSRRLILRCVQASAMSGAIVGVAGGGAFLTMPWIVDRFFPDYAGGLPALKVALLAYFLLALCAGPTYFVISTMQKRRQLMVMLVAIAVIVGGSYTLSDRGLVGIAWALVVGSGVYVTGLWTIVWRSFRSLTPSTPIASSD